jgi:hypothetical protein
MQQPLLADYVSLNEASRQPGMPSLRTLHRLAKRRQLPVVRLGKQIYLHVPQFHELLRAGTVKVSAT